MKNLEENENKDKIKEILDTTKTVKSRRQPKILKVDMPLNKETKPNQTKILKRILTSSTFGKKHNTRSYQMQK